MEYSKHIDTDQCKGTNTEDLEFTDDIDHAIFGSKILWSHLKIEILNLEKWKQEYKILYENESEHKLRYIRLTTRKKEVQRNLSVYDNMGNELPIVPSYLVEKALSRICENYVTKAYELANDNEKMQIGELSINPIDFSAIFRYDGDKDTTANAQERIRRTAMALNSKEKITISDPIFYINRVLALVSIYSEFYIPTVELETHLKQNERILLNFSVENLDKDPMDLRRFLLTGNLPISVGIGVEESVSNHFMVLSPKGLVFRDACISGIEGTTLEGKYKDLSKFLDDNIL